MDLEGKVAVITGASRGLGAGIAEAALARGISLVLCSRSAPASTFALRWSISTRRLGVSGWPSGKPATPMPNPRGSGWAPDSSNPALARASGMSDQDVVGWLRNNSLFCQ